jgi:hypothetical protein
MRLASYSMVCECIVKACNSVSSSQIINGFKKAKIFGENDEDEVEDENNESTDTEEEIREYIFK